MQGGIVMEFYVKDIMTTEIITIKESDKIRNLVKLFADNEIYGVPVLDNNDYVVGVVSSSDIMRKEKSEHFYVNPFFYDFNVNIFEDTRFFDKPVSSIMTEDIITVSPEATIEEMAKIMYDNKVHRLLVTKFDKLLGIVTTYDLLKLLAAIDKPKLKKEAA